MRTRIDLDVLIKSVLPENVSVYYQPPENLAINYPCVIYNLEGDNVDYSNDKIYNRQKRYNITVIDKNPDSIIPDRIRNLPYCYFSRVFKSDKLYHSVFVIYN